MVAGPNAIEYMKGLSKSSDAVSSTVYEQNELIETEKFNNILTLDGNENAYVLHKELGEWMTDNVTVVRENKKLLETDAKN